MVKNSPKSKRGKNEEKRMSKVKPKKKSKKTISKKLSKITYGQQKYVNPYEYFIYARVSKKEAEEAKKAGADIVGMDDFIKLLDKEKLDFDILISTPTLMAKLGKYARLLGPKGLMPNPKSGTVTMDVAKAVTQSKAGKVEYRVDSTGIVHLGIGKVSFGDTKIRDNFNAVVSNIKSNKPTSIKGAYIKGLFLSTSMGPSVQVDLSSL